MRGCLGSRWGEWDQKQWCVVHGSNLDTCMPVRHAFQYTGAQQQRWPAARRTVQSVVSQLAHSTCAAAATPSHHRDTIQYKYVLVSDDGSVEWQEGDNLSMEVPAVAPTVNGRRRGVLVLDSWLRQAPRGPRPSPQPQLEAHAASAGGAAGEAPATPVDPIHLHQQAPRFGSREGSGSSSSGEQASSSGRGGNYDALMERLQAIMASQTTPPPRPRGGKQPSGASSSSAAPASQQQSQQQQQQPQVPPLPEPVLSLWTEGPRFAGQAATEGVAQWNGSVGGPSAALQPPAGVDLADPVELGRWQALNSVMLALQHSSELSHWCDDPTDPRMLAADRRLAALTASLGGSSSFVGVSV